MKNCELAGEHDAANIITSRGSNATQNLSSGSGTGADCRNSWPGGAAMSAQPMQISLATEGDVSVLVDSFGHLHGVPRSYDLAVDLRDFIRDPHVSPQMRESTGRELGVRVHVLATPGAQALVDHLVGAALALLKTAPRARPVRIGISCSGGRHRSVTAAEAVSERIRLAGHGVLVTHHHVNEPVVRRAS